MRFPFERLSLVAYLAWSGHTDRSRPIVIQMRKFIRQPEQQEQYNEEQRGKKNTLNVTHMSTKTK